MKKRDVLAALLATLIALASLTIVVAEQDDTTITFIIPSSIAHSTAYAGSCSSSDFACRENDGTLDGTQAQINITQTDGTACQTGASAGMVITNDGNTNINVTVESTSAQPAGVTVQVGNSSGFYEAPCSLGPTAAWEDGKCKNVTTTNATVVFELASSASESLWYGCVFSNFNSGQATSGITRTLRTSAFED